VNCNKFVVFLIASFFAVALSFAKNEGGESPLNLEICIARVEPLSIRYTVRNVSDKEIFLHKGFTREGSVVTGIRSIDIVNVVQKTQYGKMVAPTDGDSVRDATTSDFFPLSPEYSITGIYYLRNRVPLPDGKYEIWIGLESMWQPFEDSLQHWQIHPWRGKLQSNHLVIDINKDIQMKSYKNSPFCNQ
jgi:hypothetical protein